MAKTIDATKIPATITIKNTNPEKVDENGKLVFDKEGMDRYEGYVEIPVYRVLTQKVELAPQDELKLIVTTSAELLFYMALAADIEGLEITVEEVTE